MNFIVATRLFRAGESRSAEKGSATTPSEQKANKDVLLPTELWLLVLQYLDGRDLKSLSLVASYFKGLSGPRMSGTILLSSQSIIDSEPLPVFLKQAHTLKLHNDNFSPCFVTPYTTPYKELGTLQSTLVKLILTGVILPRHLFCHLLSIPSIRTLELSTLVVLRVDIVTSPMGNSLTDALRSPRMSSTTVGDQLPLLHLEKLVIHNLGQMLILEVLKHTDQTLVELCLDSETPSQAAAIFRELERFKAVERLEICPKVDQVYFSSSAFPHLRHLSCHQRLVSHFLSGRRPIRSLSIRKVHFPTLIKALECHQSNLLSLELVLGDLKYWGDAELLSNVLVGVKTLRVSVYSITVSLFTWWVKMFVYSIPTLRDAALEVYLPGPEEHSRDILFHCVDILNQDDGSRTSVEHIELTFDSMTLRSIACQRRIVACNPRWRVRVVYQTRFEDWVLTDGMFISQESGYVYRLQRPARQATRSFI